MSATTDTRPREPPPAGCARPHASVVVRREALGGEVVLVTVRAEGEALLALRPGQFVQAHAFPGLDPLLPRPLAPFDVRAVEGGAEVDLLIAAIGRGTRALAGLAPGAAVRLLGPLGRGFSEPADAPAAVAGVAGGVGLAPLHHLARERRDRGLASATEVVLGARSRERLFGRQRLEALGIEVTIATDQGDAGFAGTAVQALAARLDTGLAPAIVLGCGPERMLAALAALARARGLRCEVSLEQRMACGFGVCFTCVAPLLGADGRPHHTRTCLDGPVVDAARLLERLPG